MSHPDLRKDLRGFERHAEEYYDEQEVTLDDLFPSPFIEERTEFEDVEAFLAAAPADVEDKKDLRGVYFDDFDPFVEKHTDFPDFAAMFAAAVSRWTQQHSDV